MNEIAIVLFAKKIYIEVKHNEVKNSNRGLERH